VNLLSCPGCLRSNTGIPGGVSRISKHAFLVATKERWMEILTGLKGIVNFFQSTFSNDGKRNVTG